MMSPDVVSMKGEVGLRGTDLAVKTACVFRTVLQEKMELIGCWAVSAPWPKSRPLEVYLRLSPGR